MHLFPTKLLLSFNLKKELHAFGFGLVYLLC